MINAHVEDGQIVKITTETEKDVPEGTVPLTACARGLNYHKTYFSGDRLRYPMIRTGRRGEGRFARISWEEAVDRIAEEWVRIRDAYGPGSRYVHYGWGQECLLRGNSLAQRLLALDGGYLDSYNSYSDACIVQATNLMFGRPDAGNSPEDILNTRFVILWGHNPAETRFDSVTMHYLKKLKEQGVPVTVVDPRKNDTVLALDAGWIPIRPATDAAMMDAMAYVILEEHLEDKRFLERCCSGFYPDTMPPGEDPRESYLSYLEGAKDGIRKTPRWAEKITGVPAQTIRDLAVRYASAKPAALLQGYGPQRNACGEQAARGGILLACMTGNVGVPGGYSGGFNGVFLHRRPHMPQVPDPYPGYIPVYRWTDAVDHGKEMTALQGIGGMQKLDADIKMIVNLAGNCLINQHSDINRTAALLSDTSKCEFILCSDLFMTSSAKFADILLPGTSFFETENIVSPWMYDTFLAFEQKVTEPLYECRFEYDWLAEVAGKLGLYDAFTEGRTSSEWLRFCYDELRRSERELPDYDTFRREGIYRYRPQEAKIAFSSFANKPEQYPLSTPSGRIEIFSGIAKHLRSEEEFPAIPRYVSPPEGYGDPLQKKYPLQLVGWHTKRRCHSIHDNNPEMEKIDPRCVWMHPLDAAARGITENAPVIIYNDRGRVVLPAKITDRIMPGVAGIAQGAWYDPDGSGTDRGGCINVLTSQRPTPFARANGQNTILAEIVPEGFSISPDHGGSDCR